MAQVQQRVCLAAALLILLAGDAPARRFFRDDPIQKEPPPLPAANLHHRGINEYYDFFLNTFYKPGERITPEHSIAAQGVNTLGDVPDSSWYTNRPPMPLGELRRGPATGKAPATDRPWQVTGMKSEGITPGFRIRDSRGRQYLLKVDPEKNPEMATGADVVGSKFFYALGYNTPENYIVRFLPRDLVVAPGAKFTDSEGRERPIRRRDLYDLLLRVQSDLSKPLRAVASLYIGGELLGPFKFYNVRSDDPNDIYLHEHRRDLRALRVFCAWLNHTDSKSLNTLDSLVSESGQSFVRHYLIDFGAIMGSDSFTAKSPRAGHVYLFTWKETAIEIPTLGLWVPRWATIDYPDIPAVGRFSAEGFHPRTWKPNYPNPAFHNCLPDDAYWAAKKVMAITDDQIRVMVETGQYSDPRAVDYLTRTLMARRNAIGKEYLTEVLALDHFEVRNRRLEFRDLAVDYGITARRSYQVAWYAFDNERGQRGARPVSNAFELPPSLLAQTNSYAVAEIHSGDPHKAVSVYVRNQNARIEVVGIDRTW